MPIIQAVKGLFAELVFIYASMFCISLLYMWVGILYLEAKMPSESNQRLLNNLKEGVYILDEDDFSLQFENKAAKRLDKKLLKRCDFSFIQNGKLAFKDEAFQQIDAEVVKNGDYESIVRLLSTDGENLCLQKIVAKHLASSAENKGLYTISIKSVAEIEQLEIG